MKLKNAAVLLGAGVALGTAAKKADLCPRCIIKNTLAAFRLSDHGYDKYNNAVALTPPMGWASWNKFRHHINEDIIYDIAEAMKISGLADAGYQYINIDDCWQSSMRDENGRLQGDLSAFPSGIAALCEKVNSLGLKLGIYSSNGTLTCEDLPASLGHERIDAETFAQWGIEYFKYDFCHNEPISTVAPDIEYIETEIPGSVAAEKYPAAEAKLFGTANVRQDKKLGCGNYVTGLCAGNGKIAFTNIYAGKTGEYVLTLGIRKSKYVKKFAQLTVNEKDKYYIHAGESHGHTHDGRIQTKVYLTEGRNTIVITNPVGSRMDSAALQYTLMGQELKRATALAAQQKKQAEKPIVFSICEWGKNQPWKWGAQAGNLWRTTMDIMPNWLSVVGIYECNVRLWKYASPGAWNDPDMLEVGNGNLTDDENRSHFTLWCMMAAPLILGNDLRSFLTENKTADKENKILKILTNPHAIAIDQDPRGLQCRRIRTGLVDILLKPLADHALAVCIFNKSNKQSEQKCSISEFTKLSWVDLPSAREYEVFDIWNNKTLFTENEINTKLSGHGVALFRIKVK